VKHVKTTFNNVKNLYNDCQFITYTTYEEKGLLKLV